MKLEKSIPLDCLYQQPINNKYLRIRIKDDALKFTAFYKLSFSYSILPSADSIEIFKSLQTKRVSYFQCALSRPVEC